MAAALTVSMRGMLTEALMEVKKTCDRYSDLTAFRLSNGAARLLQISRGFVIESIRRPA